MGSVIEHARAALDQGAAIINDISAGRADPAMLSLVASRGAGIVLMHMLDTPATMQKAVQYHDVVGEVRQFLVQRLWAALQNVSGGTWGGCVFDVEAILEALGGGALGR
jgi:dihydropteroate synthase